MNYSTEGIAKEVIGLGSKEFKIKIEPIPNFSVKRGETTYVVWLEEKEEKEEEKKEAPASRVFDSKSKYVGLNIPEAVWAVMQGKRVRLHADIPAPPVPKKGKRPAPAEMPLVTAIDLI